MKKELGLKENKTAKVKLTESKLKKIINEEVKTHNKESEFDTLRSATLDLHNALIRLYSAGNKLHFGKFSKQSEIIRKLANKIDDVSQDILDKGNEGKRFEFFDEEEF